MQVARSTVVFAPDGSAQSREIRQALLLAKIPFIELDEDRFEPASIEYAGASYLTREGIFSFIRDMSVARLTQ